MPQRTSKPDTRGRDDAAAIEDASLALVEMTVAALSAPSGVSPLQVRVLLAVDRHSPLNLSALARRLDISVPSASRLVDRLVEAGLLTRVIASHSRREVILAVSGKGKRSLSRIRRRRESAIAEVLTRMPEEERAALVRGLAGFARAADGAST